MHSPEVANQRRHLANALKYASAFPVIFLSAIQQLRHRSPDTPHDDVLANIVTDDFLPTVWYVRFYCGKLILTHYYYHYLNIDIILGLHLF